MPASPGWTPMSSHISARELLNKAEADARERQKAGKPVLLSPAPVHNAAKDESTVYIFDAIGSWFGIDPKTWIPEFNAIKARTIHLRINSSGGAVMDAQAMVTCIAQHPAKVVAHIDGLCASAATGLALACREVEMTDGAFFMIHNAWGCCAGSAEDMEQYAGLLRKCTGNIVASYRLKTGKPEKQIRDWMSKETWFTAEEAKAAGFIDRVFVPGGSTSNDSGRSKRARAMAIAELSLEQI